MTCWMSSKHVVFTRSSQGGATCGSQCMLLILGGIGLADQFLAELKGVL